MLPWAQPSPQPERHLNRFTRFCTECHYTFQRAVPLPLKITPSHGGSGVHLTRLWAHPSPQPKGHLNRFSRLCRDDCRVSLYFTMDDPSPLKIAPSHSRTGPPSITWFLGPTRVLNPNGISIGSAIFAGLTVTRQTDYDTRSVITGRTYVRSTAMRPNNNSNQHLKIHDIHKCTHTIITKILLPLYKSTKPLAMPASIFGACPKAG